MRKYEKYMVTYLILMWTQLTNYNLCWYYVLECFT
jgi:hypothetical protein